MEKKYNPDTIRNAFRDFFVGAESEDGEQRAFCPVCEDPGTSKSPSAMINPTSGYYNCLKGEHGGTIAKLIQQLKTERGFDIRRAAMNGRHKDPEYTKRIDNNLKKSSKRTGSLPTEKQVESWSRDLLADKNALSRFKKKRGIDETSIKELSIGWNGRRYTIPIYDEEGNLVNIRQYKLDAETQNDKVINVAGHGTARIYGYDDLEEFDDIVVVEGEPDRILLRQYLSGHNTGAITHTAGARFFNPQWGILFKDKRVWFCYDNDDTGEQGRKKAEKIVAPFADEVFQIYIPLEEKGSDITDFLHVEGHSSEDFVNLMRRSEERSLGKTSAEMVMEGTEVSLQESMSQDNQNEVLDLTVSISGKQAEPFTAPKTIEANCDMSKGVVCTLCPVAARNGSLSMEIRADDEHLFRFVDSGEQRRRTLLREIVGARCADRVTYDIPESFHIEELLVQPSVDNRRDDETQQPVKRTIYSVSTYKSGVNEKVRLTGQNRTDPKNGRLRFVAWGNEQVHMDIDSFKLSAADREELSIFQPDHDQLPLDKCLEISRDLAENVTHIYHRDLLHVAMDLVWHSVQSFRIGATLEPRGWLECLVIGDTRTGKSDVAKSLTKHYNAGTMVSCEGMSFAGIIGGVQQIDGRWHLTWGVVPMNDRRLVVLDEMSGMKDGNIIEQMSSIRSSGIAQITKISTEQTSARTRLIWISNPADGSMVRESPDVGIGAMRSIVPSAEDQARFDFVTATVQGEVPSSAMNSGYSPDFNPQYSSEACEKLIKWAWSLTRDDVHISESAIKASQRLAEDMGKRYIPSPPLIQVENVRIKIMRVAAAIAARTFSCRKKDGKLMVQLEHVKDAVRFLDMVYEQESMGYARRSRSAIAAEEEAKKRRATCKAYLLEHEDDVLQTLRMVGGTTFRNRDFEEFGALSRDESHVAVKQLLKMRMVHRKSRGDIGMNPILLDILREIADEEEE